MMNDLFPYLGIPTMISIEILVHTEGGIVIGYNVHGVLILFPLLYWQVSHSTTKLCTSYFITSPKKECFISSYVL